MKKILLVYYSYTGNTKQIAQYIKKNIQEKQVDLLQLHPKKPYSTDYQKVVDEEEAKMDQKETVALHPINLQLESYDEIILGTPVWWYTIPPVVRSFLKEYSLKDKEIHAFITNGGWLGHTVEELKEYTNLKSYINLTFNGNTLQNDQKGILNWIKNL